MNYYQQSIPDAVSALDTSVTDGLSGQTAAKRLAEHGPNEIHHKASRTPLRMFLEQFKNWLVLLLIGAAALSFFLQSYRDGIILLLIVALNATVGFYQDWKSENILQSLKSLIIDKCYVIREGKKIEIPSMELVPGDLVLMNEGDGVPADIRLTDSTGFSTSDFILTGESQPREKSSGDTRQSLAPADTRHEAEPRASAASRQPANVPVSERDNCVFMGTTVAKGMGRGLVFATGMDTELGKIAGTSSTIDVSPTPLQTELNDVGKKITWITLVLSVILFIGRLLTGEHYDAALIFAIGVAAAMVPEGLPAQISVSLALGVARLARKNAIVKRISAVEALGAATVIATDKTGTITKNEMTILHCHLNGKDFTITGTGYEPKGQILDIDGNVMEKDNLGEGKVFFLNGFLGSTGRVNPPDAHHKDWYPIGDPTECAFATLLMKAGYDPDEIEQAYPRVAIFPFDSVRKRVSIIREHKNRHISFVKGSLESILEKSNQTIADDKIELLTAKDKERYANIAKIHAADAYRVIALAFCDLEKKSAYTLEEAEDQLVFAGFVAMIDPPHDEVKAAIKTAYDAGMKVMMITGDNDLTARAIALQTGISNEDGSVPEVIGDQQLRDMTDEQLKACFGARSLIFSRVAPDEKLRIVSLLKDEGEIVAVTGDGVNDTLSLKKADIGIAMGKHGSKVAQEAAGMVLLDDDFSSIVLAIKEGRNIYNNLKKITLANLVGNTAELTCILIGFTGSFFNYPLVLMPLHILLIDLIGNMLPLLMIAFDPPETDLMHQAPRKTGQMLTTRNLVTVLFAGLFKGFISFFAYYMSYRHHAGESLGHEKAVTVTMVSLIVCQFVNIFSSRTRRGILSRYFFSNVQLFAGVLLSAMFMLIVSYVPVLQGLLHTGPLDGWDWAYVGGGAGAFLLVMEGYKKWREAEPRAS